MQGKTVAIYRYKRNGKRIALRENIYGQLYVSRLDYDGMYFAGATTDFTPARLGWLKELHAENGIEWLETPDTLYHVWHICCCEKCCPEVKGSLCPGRSGGKVWSHSQADWDSHLKFVDAGLIGTFPTVENEETPIA